MRCFTPTAVLAAWVLSLVGQAAEDRFATLPAKLQPFGANGWRQAALGGWQLNGPASGRRGQVPPVVKACL